MSFFAYTVPLKPANDSLKSSTFMWFTTILFKFLKLTQSNTNIGMLVKSLYGRLIGPKCFVPTKFDMHTKPRY